MTPFVFGTSARMKDLERKIGFIARSGLPVLLEGACGTGKEMLAELLHESSGKAGSFLRILCRQSGPVIHVPLRHGNGAGDLGHLYQSAKGTLFLKDVHLLTPAVQEQFLTVLEQQSDSPEANSNGVGVRLISSTTEALDPFIERRQFLAGLYYRLSVCRLSLPPLRERIQDIPELFATMLRRYSNGAGEPPPCPSHLLDALAGHTWPGNVRELLNVARTYAVTRDADQIVAELGGLLHAAHSTGSSSGLQLSLKEQVRGASQKLETEIILRTLERHRWNRRRAAQSLRISYRSLLYKMKSCNLRVETQTTPEGIE
jgi:DNA-binding NtrC family response regulator